MGRLALSPNANPSSASRNAAGGTKRNHPPSNGHLLMTHPLRAHLFKSIFWPTLLITLGLTLLMALLYSFRFLPMIAFQGAPWHVLPIMTAAFLPTFLAIAVPGAFALSVGWYYHGLDKSGQLTAISAMGLSPWTWIKKPLWITAALFLGLGYVTMWAGPQAFSWVTSYQNIMEKAYFGILQPGKFFRWNGDVLYAHQQIPPRNFQGIFLFSVRSNAWHILHAKTAQMDKDPLCLDMNLYLGNGTLIKIPFAPGPGSSPGHSPHHSPCAHQATGAISSFEKMSLKWPTPPTPWIFSPLYAAPTLGLWQHVFKTNGAQQALWAKNNIAQSQEDAEKEKKELYYRLFFPWVLWLIMAWAAVWGVALGYPSIKFKPYASSIFIAVMMLGYGALGAIYWLMWIVCLGIISAVLIILMILLGRTPRE